MAMLTYLGRLYYTSCSLQLQHLRHPNLYVANLLGEACPIFKKSEIFAVSWMMSPGGSVETL